jgi:hypothetical protein
MYLYLSCFLPCNIFCEVYLSCVVQGMGGGVLCVPVCAVSAKRCQPGTRCCLPALMNSLVICAATIPHKHCCVQVLCRRGDAGSALAAASRLAAQQGSLAAVPSWALMPSSLQRHWIK